MASKRVDEIVEAAINSNLLDNKGEIAPWSSPNWQIISNRLNASVLSTKISKDYLYTLIRCNRYNILTKIKSALGIEFETEVLSPNTDSSDVDSYKNESDVVSNIGKYSYILTCY